MHILLLSPKGPLYRHSGGIFKKSLRYAPLTLTTLAAYVPKELGATVSIADEGVRDIDLGADADLVGITCITGSAPRAYELADAFRSRGIKVVLGGPHPTLLPDEAAAHADAVVVGYAETSWPRLLRDFAKGQLQPRYAQEANLSLAGLPFPRREMMDPKSYLTTNVFEATRACGHDCEFCVAPTAWGRRQYQKPVEDVAADITQYGAKKLLFIDLNLVSDPTYARRLFEALVPLKVKWFGLTTTLILHDQELMDLAAKSGCSGLLIGFESLCDAALGGTKKAFNDPKNYKPLIRALHDRGIALMGCFAFGLDGDGPEVFEQTAEFCIDVAIDLPRFAIVTPFPGTPLHKRLDAEGRLLHKDWTKYDAQHVVFRPKRMTVEQLERGHEWAWKRTYEWGAIARRLLAARTNPLYTVPANVGYRFYAHNLHRFYNCDWFVQAAPAKPAGAPEASLPAAAIAPPPDEPRQGTGGAPCG